MDMASSRDMNELLHLAKRTAETAGRWLVHHAGTSERRHTHSEEHPREIKAAADRVMDGEILGALRPAGLPILSEESGLLGPEDAWRFIVDPLDGTYNFVRNLGQSAVSIGLWEGDQPLFGVVFTMPDERLYWGGRGLGAFCDGQPIAVSTTSEVSKAAICTGIPARADVTGPMTELLSIVRAFGKVRMLGSATVSLARVAEGSADAYWEQDIMLWDVAAGLAIVEGAGGSFTTTPGSLEYALTVFAGNGRVTREFSNG
jgi:myo-inositol-1(or 4)-monophosphatase